MLDDSDSDSRSLSTWISGLQGDSLMDVDTVSDKGAISSDAGAEMVSSPGEDSFLEAGRPGEESLDAADLFTDTGEQIRPI